jgi:hypothetical protein
VGADPQGRYFRFEDAIHPATCVTARREHSVPQTAAHKKKHRELLILRDTADQTCDEPKSLSRRLEGEQSWRGLISFLPIYSKSPGQLDLNIRQAFRESFHRC